MPLRNLSVKSKPVREGVRASEVLLTPRDGHTLHAALCARFATIPPEEWARRIEAGAILDTNERPLQAKTPLTDEIRVYYFRSVGKEPRVEGEVRILYADAQLLVADKPHFLPVAPVGAYVQETLLTRLISTTGLAALSPLHRLDKDTAGVVLFAVDTHTRNAYQSLFRHHDVEKIYEAVAPSLPTLITPTVIENRLEDDPAHFMKMCVVPGVANAKTRIERIATAGTLALYRLQPETGQRHQLRVHMAALGAPIMNDRIYPTLQPQGAPEDFTKPLQLLAKSIAFIDPISQKSCKFESKFRLIL